jgi:hypothetical protein
MTYEEKKAIADAYIFQQVGLGWDDLEDINSLHDSESVEDIHDSCEDRLRNEYPD